MENEDSDEQVQQYQCKHCGSRSDTIFDKEPSKMTFILSFLSLIFFGFYSILLIPLIIQATRTIVKKCYDCNEVIESHDLFSLPSFNDQVLNFRFGNCAIILSRKYAYAILFAFICLYGIIQYNSETVEFEQMNSKYSSRSWEQYVNDCGKDTFISNGVKAKANFLKHYDDKIINWEGAFIQYKFVDNVINQSFGVYIKMSPTDSSEGVQDIILILTKQQNNKYKSILQDLNEGDILNFSGKLTHMGDEYSYHAVNIENLSKTEKHINIAEIPTFTEHNIRNNNNN